MAEFSDTMEQAVDLTGNNVVHLANMTSGTSLTHRRSRRSPSANSNWSGLPLRQRSSKLSKYGVSFQPPQDDAIHFHTDTKNISFFEKGRDFESTYTNHQYTSEERDTLGTFESQDYLPSHSEVYKNWIKRQPSRLDWDQWIVMGLIGFIVGLMGFLLHQTIEWLTDIRIKQTTKYLAENNLLLGWIWCMGFSMLFLIVGSALVVFLRPAASGSGIPELIGFLNGTQVRHIFNVKTLVIKFLSCCLSVGSGLPVGPEGPMIHLGSLVGAGISQFKSDTLNVKFPVFERFRNSEDRRNFVSAGAAAGVSTAFGAPVGGLLFSMEEVSSFWNDRLSWQIFFCCMVSVFTSSLFNSAFKGFDFTGSFGLFKSKNFILFKVYHGFDFHIAVFVPTIIIGVLGGTLGAMFTFVNLKIARARKSFLSGIRSTFLQKFCRLIEPLTILILYISASVLLPSAFSCTKFQCVVQSNQSHEDGGEWCVSRSDKGQGFDWFADPNGTESYNCPPGGFEFNGTLISINRTYNEVATLLLTNGERAIRHLFSRETHYEFSFLPLFTVLCVYFFCACWAAGTAISSGLVVPMLLIGAIYGRMIGIAMVSMFGEFQGNKLWAWIDPGAMALIGAASFFGGVSRLTMSLTVIMMELTNDIQFLLPIMVAIMVAKWVGDFFTHPIYHALLEMKCIPFLSSEPIVYNEKKRRMNLELYTAGNVMSTDVITLFDKENIQRIADILLNTTHCGFPVLSNSSKGRSVFAGTITRLELTVLLKHKASFIEENGATPSSDVTAVEYEQLNIDKLENPLATEDMLNDYATLPEFSNTKIYLRPYMNQSAMSVRANFSLHRTYIIFRTLGLRHLTITSEDGGEVVGMITRRDLMGHNLEKKLDHVRQNIGLFSSVPRESRDVNSTYPVRRTETEPETRQRVEQARSVVPDRRSLAITHSIILEAGESDGEGTQTGTAARELSPPHAPFAGVSEEDEPATLLRAGQPVSPTAHKVVTDPSPGDNRNTHNADTDRNGHNADTELVHLGDYQSADVNLIL